MTKPKHENMMKRLGKMVWYERKIASFYELPEKYAPYLLDLGYIEEHKWISTTKLGYITCSEYIATDKGEEAYIKWSLK